MVGREQIFNAVYLAAEFILSLILKKMLLVESFFCVIYPHRLLENTQEARIALSFPGVIFVLIAAGTALSSYHIQSKIIAVCAVSQTCNMKVTITTKKRLPMF